MSFTRFLLLLLSITLLSGCYAPDTSALAKQPLLVDLTVIARALGRDKEINTKLEEARTSLNSQLNQISSSLETQLKEKKSEFDESNKGKKEEAIAASNQELQQLAVQAQLQLKQKQQLAEQKATIFRAQLLNDFRKEVADVAQQVAKKRGAITVLTVNADYLWYDSSIDITDEVIGIMRSLPDNNKSEKVDDTSKAESSKTETSK